MNLKTLAASLCLSSLMVLAACSNAESASISAWGQSHHVKHFSGGVLIGEWDTNGKVENEGQSDGYYFMDKATGKKVAISGTVEITVN